MKLSEEEVTEIRRFAVEVAEKYCPEQPEDVAHDVLAKVMKRDLGGQEPSFLKAYIAQAVRNVSITYWRKNRRCHYLPQMMLADLASVPSFEGEISVANVAESVLQDLPPPHREAISLYLDGYAVAEIGRLTSLSSSTAYRWIASFKARVKFVYMSSACGREL